MCFQKQSPKIHSNYHFANNSPFCKDNWRYKITGITSDMSFPAVSGIDKRLERGLVAVSYRDTDVAEYDVAPVNDPDLAFLDDE